MLMNIRKSMKSQKGFTLVELLVVVVIIGVLAAIAIPKFTGSTDEANAAKVKADIRTVQSALALYNAKNNGTYPTATSFAELVSALKTANLLQDTVTELTDYTYTYDQTTGAVAATKK